MDETKIIQSKAQKEVEELLKLKPGDPRYDDYFRRWMRKI